MTSEIRANTLKNRVGLGTIEYSNTGPVISGVTTSNNFKTGSTNVHSVGIEAAGINVLGADTPIGTGATIYNSGAAVFTGEVTATSFSGIVKATNLTSDRVVFTTTNGQLEASGNLTYNGTTFANASTTYFDNQVYWRNSGTNKMFTLSNNSGMNWQDDVKAEFGNSGDLKIYNVSSENHIYGSTSQPIIFSTNTDERLRIDSTGALGLGVGGITSYFKNNSGNYRQLQIGLGAHFYGRTDDTPLYLVSNGYRDGSNWKYTANTTASQIAMGTHIVFETAGVGTAGNNISFDERLRITSDGKVGINQTNPTAQIHSTAAYNVTGAIIGGGASGYNNTLEVQNAGGTRLMTVKGDGKVGIGSDDPQKNLDIYTGQAHGSIRIHNLNNGSTGYDSELSLLGSASNSEMRINMGVNSDPDREQIKSYQSDLIFTTNTEERLRISDGLITLKDSTGAYHKPTLKIANQYHGRYGGSLVFTAENGSGTEYTTGRIRAYGGSDDTGGQIGVGCGDFMGDGDKIRINKDGKIAISPTGNCTSYTDSLAVTIIQNGGTNGYPGLHIKSTHGGGDEGMSLVATDDNWDLYTLSGNENGLGILRAGSASSGNARFYLTQSGHLTVGDHTYTDLDTSKRGNTMMHVAGGGLSVGPKGNHAQSTEGGRYVLGWYMTGYSSSNSYLHLITDLWAGGSPHGNSEYIMGGFHIHGHQYSGGQSVSRERIYFHNWSGGYPGYSNSNGGNWAPGNTVYTHSTGYVTLRLLTGNYRGYIIDLIQHAWYPSRNITVTSATYSDSSTL